MVGGSSHPIGMYSLRSELVSGTTRYGAVGRTFTWYRVGVSASLRVGALLLASRYERTRLMRSFTWGRRANWSGAAS